MPGHRAVSPGARAAAEMARFFLWGAALLSELFELIVRIVRPSTWRHPVRRELIRQIHLAGVQPLPLILLIAFVAGAVAVAQSAGWLAASGSAGLVPKFTLLLIREAAPLAVAMTVIVRAGSVTVVELATVRATDQDRMLIAHGMDEFVYLVVPRAVGMALATLCLLTCLISITLSTASITLEIAPVPGVKGAELIRDVFALVSSRDVVVAVLNAVIPTSLAALLGCRIALGVESSLTEVPRVLPAFFVQAFTATALVMGLVVAVL